MGRSIEYRFGAYGDVAWVVMSFWAGLRLEDGTCGSA